MLVSAEDSELNNDTTKTSKCEIISGNGKNIGDEIACGTEHFYVVSNDGENVSMLAKYNLNVGYTFNLI